MDLSNKTFLAFLYRPVIIIRTELNQFRNYFLPNIKAIIKRKITLIENRPICRQYTKLSGAGRVEIGAGCFFGYKYGGFHRGGSVEIQSRYKNSIIKIGSNVVSNNNVFICSANYIEIGSDTLIGQNVFIIDHEAHGIDPLERRKLGVVGKVIIGRNVWIGNNVVILKNTEIGDNSIIATGAVVSGKFPADMIIGGVPAKIIRRL